MKILLGLSIHFLLTSTLLSQEKIKLETIDSKLIKAIDIFINDSDFERFGYGCIGVKLDYVNSKIEVDSLMNKLEYIKEFSIQLTPIYFGFVINVYGKPNSYFLYRNTPVIIWTPLESLVEKSNPIDKKFIKEISCKLADRKKAFSTIPQYWKITYKDGKYIIQKRQDEPDLEWKFY